MSSDAGSGSGNPEQGAPQQPQQGAPQQGAPQQGAPWGTPPSGPPPAGAPWGTPQGVPPQMPPQGMPPQTPPGYPQGYWPGQPQPGWGQPGWPPPQPRKSNRGCIIAAIVGLVLLGVVVVSCVALLAVNFGPAVAKGLEIQNNSGGQISSVSYNIVNGHAEFQFRLSSAVTDPETAGPQLACNVVRPALRGTEWENTDFVIIDSRGFMVASNLTPCP